MSELLGSLVVMGVVYAIFIAPFVAPARAAKALVAEKAAREAEAAARDMRRQEREEREERMRSSEAKARRADAILRRKEAEARRVEALVRLRMMEMAGKSEPTQAPGKRPAARPHLAVVGKPGTKLTPEVNMVREPAPGFQSEAMSDEDIVAMMDSHAAEKEAGSM